MPTSFSLPRGARRLIVAPVAVAALLVGAGLPSQEATASPRDPQLVSALGTVLNDSRSKTESSAIVLDATDGTMLYGRNSTKALIPASNTKSLTAAAALETLGPSYRFKTDVIRRAKINNGVLEGRLYLKGYGDPTTRLSDLTSLAKQVRAAGIHTVEGKLVADSTFFDAQRYNPNWNKSYATDYYAAEISALTLAPNADLDSGTVYINYQPGKKGSKAKITTTPAAAAKYLKINNQTTTSASGTSTTIKVSRAWQSKTVTVTGRIATNRGTSSRLITVTRPDLYAAAVFRAELAKAGVKVLGSTTSLKIPAGSQKRIARDYSMPLSQLMTPFMKLSNNMHAEALTKTMGTLKGRPGNWTDGLSYTTGYLRTIGVPMTGVALVDGSGLTRGNRITPRALATLLQKAQAEPWFPIFRGALPVAGNRTRMVGGTLRNRMDGTAAANNARAKTGTLTGVTALSGYVTGADGRRYVFAMISNYSGSTPRPVENSFVIKLARWNG